MRTTFTIVGVLALTVVAPRAESQVKLGAAFGPGWETDGSGDPSGTHFALSATLRRQRPSSATVSRHSSMVQSRPSTAEATNVEHRHATFAVTLSAVRRFSNASWGRT